MDLFFAALPIAFLICVMTKKKRAPVYGRFCAGGAVDLPDSDRVLPDEPAAGSRSDLEWAAAGAHSHFDCVWGPLLLCRTGTLRCHGDTDVVAGRYFAKSGGTADACWLVIHFPDRGCQRLWHPCRR